MTRNLVVDLWTNFANFSKPTPDLRTLNSAGMYVNDLMAKDTLFKPTPKVWKGDGKYVRIINGSLNFQPVTDLDKRMAFWMNIFKKIQLDLFQMKLPLWEK